MELKFKRLPNGENLPLPFYATEGSAGMDLCAAEDVILTAGQSVVVKTGFAVAVPQGYELQIRSRSGLAAKNGISVLNSPGTIDSDYRGELMVILDKNVTGFVQYKVFRGDKIAQAVLCPVVTARPVEVDVLPVTARGTGGLGSTGR